MAIGTLDGEKGPMNVREAAAHMGIAVSTALKYAAHPLAKQHYNRVLQEMRDGERGKNIRRLAQIRDQDANLTAAVQAIKGLEPAAEVARTQVSIGVGVQVTAGYVLAPPDFPRAGGRAEPAPQAPIGPPADAGYKVLPPLGERCSE
ncbi:hypothetical protein [Terrihabitans sp. B22-R8]|uniref:hypothetical protein n=1 Tax=Terrihabitans sp. B22-R8 TaxID=3425128 RepID=UPI00403D41C7